MILKSRNRHHDVVVAAWRKAQTGEELDGAERFAIEAIIIPDRRPAIEIVRGDYGHVANPGWSNLNDEELRARLRRVFGSIGRIEVVGYPGKAARCPRLKR